ncbi:tetratricopeptide repeat protein [Kibdelosporangium philippinense]|uniref:Tetratricopeptide repeat protein n=1 Tax=Kibdelosporangium philippinense TaxID=211113 RepID=A0ABS8ZH37_9PSEU|nr:tetratricopeptide repeat protein [Kibdelosporangium philippinense]MCE7007141.1 tetratricopeptide repeat protein [Kibdelosporangium philippinense]
MADEPIAVALRRAADLTAAGNSDAAIHVVRGVLDEHPTHSEAWCHLGAAYLDVGDAESSLDAAKQAIRHGERSWGYRLASVALMELGRRDEAVVSAREAVRRDGEDWRCHVALAEALGTQDPQESFAAACRGIQLANNEARPFEVLGDAALRVHDKETARRAYYEAIKIDPANQHARTNLVRLGRPQLGTTTAPVQAEPIVQVHLGRIEELGLWLALRRSSIGLTIGSLVLMLVGLDDTYSVLGWFGLVLVLFVVFVVGSAWVKYARGVPVKQTLVEHRMLALAAGLMALSSVLLIVWTVLVALGAQTLNPLTIVLVTSVASVVVSVLAIWRRSHPK